MAVTGSYHGNTLGSLSVSANESRKAAYAPCCQRSNFWNGTTWRMWRGSTTPSPASLWKPSKATPACASLPRLAPSPARGLLQGRCAPHPRRDSMRHGTHRQALGLSALWHCAGRVVHGQSAWRRHGHGRDCRPPKPIWGSLRTALPWDTSPRLADTPWRVQGRLVHWNRSKSWTSNMSSAKPTVARRPRRSSRSAHRASPRGIHRRGIGGRTRGPKSRGRRVGSVRRRRGPFVLVFERPSCLQACTSSPARKRK